MHRVLSERPSSTQDEPMAPVIGIGGLLSKQVQWGFYSALLGGASSHGLSVKERFWAIPSMGLGPFDEMYGQLEERLVKTHDRLGERVVLWGHSLGGLMVSQLGLHHPDKVADVVCLAGAQQGVGSLTVAGRALKRALGNPTESGKLLADSDFMKDHMQSLAERWSPTTGMHLVAPTTDYLIPTPWGLGIKLPEGQQPTKKYVAPHGIPGALIRKVMRLGDDVDLMRDVPADHISLPVTPSVINYMRQVRRSAAAPSAELIQLPSQSPSLAPARTAAVV